MNAHKEAFLARQAGPPAMNDGLVETAGLPGDEELELELEEELDEELELEEELASEDDVTEDETPTEDEAPADDTIQALDDLTIPQLKELADSREIEYPSDIHKADLVELIASS